MSRLSPDRLLIGFAPGELSLVRLRGRWRPKVVEKRSVVASDPAGGAEPWRGAVAALKPALAAAASQALDATVVLSSHLVRYALIPWSDSLRSEKEEQAYCRHHFARIFGERAKGWVPRASEAPKGGGPRLASAIDAGLVDGLRECFSEKRNARLVSVQPYLMAAFNRWRTSIPESGAWLLLLEPDRASLALYSEQSWRAVQSAKGRFGAPEDWAALLQRERHRVEGEVPDLVLVTGTPGARLDWPRVDGWQFRSLALPESSQFPQAESERYALALCA